MVQSPVAASSTRNSQFPARARGSSSIARPKKYSRAVGGKPSAALETFPKTRAARTPARSTSRSSCETNSRERTQPFSPAGQKRSEEHTSELQSPCNLVCRLLLEKKKQ